MPSKRMCRLRCRALRLGFVSLLTRDGKGGADATSCVPVEEGPLRASGVRHSLGRKCDEHLKTVGCVALGPEWPS
eukprot:10986440-Lingulodinium_polyedra.AAC.1